MARMVRRWTPAMVGRVRLATWNVNSLKARLFRVEAWLEEVQPDVVCLQETKLADSAFPTMAFQSPRRTPKPQPFCCSRRRRPRSPKYGRVK